MNDEVVVGLLEIEREHFYIVSVRLGVSPSTQREYAAKRTMAAQFQINNI